MFYQEEIKVMPKNVKPEIYKLKSAGFPGFNYEPEVFFTIQRTDNSLVLFFNVKEECFQAINTEINSPVWQDSAVEFFISFDKKNYYNLEFNAIGALLGQYGTSRNSRIFLEPDILKNIKITTSFPQGVVIKPTSFHVEWTIEIEIPSKIFIFDNINFFNPTINAYGNIYKCGDALAKKHYLSFFPINSTKPDFHRPEDFGLLIFG